MDIDGDFMKVLHPDFQQLTLSQKFIVAGVGTVVFLVLIFGLRNEDHFATSLFLFVNVAMILQWLIFPYFTKNYFLSLSATMLLSVLFAFFAGPPLHAFVDGNYLAALLIFGPLMILAFVGIARKFRKSKA